MLGGGKTYPMETGADLGGLHLNSAARGLSPFPLSERGSFFGFPPGGRAGGRAGALSSARSLARSLPRAPLEREKEKESLQQVGRRQARRG